MSKPTLLSHSLIFQLIKYVDQLTIVSKISTYSLKQRIKQVVPSYSPRLPPINFFFQPVLR